MKEFYELPGAVQKTYNISSRRESVLLASRHEIHLPVRTNDIVSSRPCFQVSTKWLKDSKLLVSTLQGASLFLLDLQILS